MEPGKRTFEQSMGRLEEIVKILERGDASLEDALKLFEEGTALIRKCDGMLSTAEQKVLLLTKNGGEDDSATFGGQEPAQ